LCRPSGRCEGAVERASGPPGAHSHGPVCREVGRSVGKQGVPGSKRDGATPRELFGANGKQRSRRGGQGSVGTTVTLGKGFSEPGRSGGSCGAVHGRASRQDLRDALRSGAGEELGGDDAVDGEGRLRTTPWLLKSGGGAPRGSLSVTPAGRLQCSPSRRAVLRDR
jgi:hypothetical protein